MTESISSKWNARYAHSDEGVPAPAEVLSRGSRWLPSRKVPIETTVSGVRQLRALDLACGLAGNARYLAKAGFEVSAWDISESAIEKINAREPALITDVQLRDIVKHPPEPQSFDVIVVTRFLDRNLCAYITDALRPGGVLFYQTFSHGLRDKNFMLEPNELLRLFKTLHVLEYVESYGTSDAFADSADSSGVHSASCCSHIQTESSLIARSTS